LVDYLEFFAILNNFSVIWWWSVIIGRRENPYTLCNTFGKRPPSFCKQTDQLSHTGGLWSPTIVTIVKLWLDRTTNSSIGLMFTYSVSTIVLPSSLRWLDQFQDGGGTWLKLKKMYSLDYEWYYLLILGHIHVWLCRKYKRANIINRCKELCRLETPLYNLWIRPCFCFQP
jgi:hypothetical protein